MGCMGFFAIPAAGGFFFFCSWIVMIFWGIVAPDVGVETISYTTAMVVTIGLWLAVAPLMAVIAKREGGWPRWFKG
jgi:hypothetical protein